MSVEARAVALAEAIKFNNGQSETPQNIVKNAEVFAAFLLGPASKPATASTAGAEPSKPAATKPAATKPAADPKAAKAAAKAAAEAAAAKAALEAAEAETEAEGGAEEEAPTDPFTADKAGVAGAVAAMIANKTGTGPDRDKAIELLKKYKAASVSAMQAKDAATIEKFVTEVNEAFGLGGEPDLES
jgi:hypothetical protein